MLQGMVGDAGQTLERGRRALRDCDWSTAEAIFRDAVVDDPSPQVVDGLGEAIYWQGRYTEALELRQRAYGMYRERGERRPAALVAIRLAQLHGLIYGNAAAFNGWLGHAQRMLEDGDDCVEQGWLELLLGGICSDPAEREQHTRAAVDRGRRFGSTALEFDALGHLGKARVEQGAVDEGLRLVDEAVAAVTSGIVDDQWAAGEIYCTLFHVCEMTIDARRAESWLATVDGYVELTGELPISGICMMHYGGLLVAAGRWVDAEHELLRALSIYDDTYRGTRSEPLVRLADLRVRQGRLEEAERLLEGNEDHREATLARSRLFLATGDPELAEHLIARHLAHGNPSLPESPLVALQVDARLAVGDVVGARNSADVLVGLAERTGLASVRGLASRSLARLAAAAGTDEVLDHLYDALSAFTDAGLQHEAATVRLELAELLCDHAPGLALAEARTAVQMLDAVGSGRDADAAARLLRQLGDTGRARPRTGGALTTRQAEVLELLAEGLTNAQIAERLFISPRTAEHHVSNILAALGLRTRAEAVAFQLRRRTASL